MDFSNNGGGAGMYMPVAPAYGGGYGNGGFGSDWAWIIILLMCGWGGMGFGGGFGGGYGGFYDFPWILQGQQNTDNNVNNGFRDQMINSGINSLGDKVVSGFGDLQTSLCSGFAGVNATVNAAANGITNRLYDDTIANMERSFALQGQVAQGFNSTAAGTADLKYTIASEACATRANSTANSQAILDKLCQLELDGVKAQVAAEQRENANLRTELMYARGQASQIEQTAILKAGQAAEVDALYNRLSSCPVPSTPVYGRTPIFTCNNGCGCGCGNNGLVA